MEEFEIDDEEHAKSLGGWLEVGSHPTDGANIQV